MLHQEKKQNETCYVVIASLIETFSIKGAELKEILDNPPQSGVDDITDCVFPTGAVPFRNFWKPITQPFSSFDTKEKAHEFIKERINDYIRYGKSLEKQFIEKKLTSTGEFKPLQAEILFLEQLLEKINKNKKENTYWILQCRIEKKEMDKILGQTNAPHEVFLHVENALNAGTKEVILPSPKTQVRLYDTRATTVSTTTTVAESPSLPPQKTLLSG